MNLDQEGRKHLIFEEGKRLKAYLDTKGIPTIWIGNTSYPDGTKVKMGDVITEQQGWEMFAKIERLFTENINKKVRVPLTQNQFNACFSFSWNIGMAAFNNSTFLKLLNKGNYKGAADAMLMWSKPAEIIPRRKRERELFIK